MKPWPSHPLIYEINTWVWLRELSQKYQQALTLGTVPQAEWEAIAALGFDAVWLMGVWQRSPAGIKIAMRNRGLIDDFKRALPDFAAQDNVGSPYCVRRYVVDEQLGGPPGLAAARRELRQRGLRLILDFVPNHVAPDHPWVDGAVDGFLPVANAPGLGKGVDCQQHFTALAVGVADAIGHRFLVEVETGEITCVGVILEAEIDGIGTVVYSGFEGWQAAGRADEIGQKTHGDQTGRVSGAV